jgi:hypothetical protein
MLAIQTQVRIQPCLFYLYIDLKALKDFFYFFTLNKDF